MKIAAPKETHSGESRAALTPEAVGKLVRHGAEVEADPGLLAGFSDEAYSQAGGTVGNDRKKLLSSAGIILRLRKPMAEEVSSLKPGSVHISLLSLQ